MGKGPRESLLEEDSRVLKGTQNKTGERILGWGYGMSKGREARKSLMNW